jgi:hypothetical protein
MNHVRFGLSSRKAKFILAALEIAYEMCALIYVSVFEQTLQINASEVFHSSSFIFRDKILLSQEGANPPINVTLRCDDLIEKWKMYIDQDSFEIWITHENELVISSYCQQTKSKTGENTTLTHIKNPFFLDDYHYFQDLTSLIETNTIITCDVRIHDLTNAMLCMCLGNGFFKIRMVKNGDLWLFSNSESGQIHVIVQTNIKKFVGTMIEHVFVTKFCKNFLTTLQHNHKQCLLHFMQDRLIFEIQTKKSKKFLLYLFPQISKSASQT